MSETGSTVTSSAGFLFSRFLSLGRALASRADFGLIVILALPWALFAIGTNWVFDYIFGCRGCKDAWVYSGFFVNLPTYITAFPSTYYGSRLSWVLPGYAAYQLFPPLVAAYVLHLGLYYAAVISLYLTLKHTVSQRAALLSAVLMGCHGYFLWAMGWDYIDGAGIAYFLMATLALTRAATSRRSWIWLILSGALYGAMIYSQLFLVVFTPALLLYYFASSQKRWQSLLRGSLFVSLGFLAVSSLLGAIHRQLGGEFLFYIPSINYAIRLAGNANPWSQPLSAWWEKATWLVLPSLAFLGSVAFLLIAWRLRSDRRIRVLMLFQLYFLTCALTSAAFEAAGSPVLMYSYYASFLMPTVFLAVAAQISLLTDRLSLRDYALVVFGMCAILFLTQRFPGPSSQLPDWLSAYAPRLLFLPALVGMALVFLRGGSARIVAVFLPCLAVAVVNISSAPFRTRNPGLSQPAFLAIVQSEQAIRSVEPSGKPLFWYSSSGSDGQFYRALASTHLWGHSLINERFPSLEKGNDSLQETRPNARLVVLSNEKDAFQQAASALRQKGLGAEFLEERRIQEGPVGWNMTFIRVHDWPVVEVLQLTANGWPEGIKLRSESGEQQVVSLVGPEAHPLLQSEMNSVAEWQKNRYGLSGGLTIESDCLASGDSCGLYSSGDGRDHLASPFVTLTAADRAAVFFCIWVKPTTGPARPRILIQNERLKPLAESEDLLTREDGWVLQGKWLEVKDARQLRITVNQPAGTASLLDKALLLEISPEPSTISAAAP